MPVSTEKQIAIMNATFKTAKLVVSLSKEAFPKRRLFGKIDRRPLKRIKKRKALAFLMISAAVGASQIAIIASRPIPKFPRGAAINDKSQNQ